jgi:hypothetical protein
LKTAVTRANDLERGEPKLARPAAAQTLAPSRKLGRNGGGARQRLSENTRAENEKLQQRRLSYSGDGGAVAGETGSENRNQEPPRRRRTLTYDEKNRHTAA